MDICDLVCFTPWSFVRDGFFGIRLDHRGIAVRLPAGTRDFSLTVMCPYRLWDSPSLLFSGCKYLI